MKKDYKISLIFLVIFLTIILFLTWFAIRIKNSAQDKIRSDLEVEMARLEGNFSDRMNYTTLMMKNINLNIAENPFDKDYIGRILRIYRTGENFSANFSWTVLSWIDKNYQLVITSNDGILAKPMDVSSRSYIAMTEQYPGILHFEAPIIGLSTKKWLIPAAMGLRDQNGKYLGALVLGFEVKTLAKLMHEVIQNPEIKFSLFGKNEVPILYGDHQFFGVDRSNDDAANNTKISKILNQIYLHEDKKFFDIALFGNRHAFLVKKVKSYPHVLILKYNPQAIAMEILRTTHLRLFEIFSTLFGLIVLMVLVLREKQQTSRILRLQQESELANEEKTEFLVKVAHEFKNFIFGIQGCAEIIKNDLGSLVKNLKNEDQQALQKLKTNLELSRNIITISYDFHNFLSEALDMNHIKNDSLKIRKSSRAINLAKIINKVINESKKYAESCDIILTAKVDSKLYELPSLDQKRMKQIITSLIGNAVRYSQNGTVVEVIARNISNKNELKKIHIACGVKKSKAIEIIVKDQGCGMTENEIKIALQSTRNIQNVDSLTFSLPVIKYLIEKQGGILEIKSQKSEGSEIRIILGTVN